MPHPQLSAPQVWTVPQPLLDLPLHHSACKTRHSSGPHLRTCLGPVPGMDLLHTPHHRKPHHELSQGQTPETSRPALCCTMPYFNEATSLKEKLCCFHSSLKQQKLEPNRMFFISWQEKRESLVGGTEVKQACSLAQGMVWAHSGPLLNSNMNRPCSWQGLSLHFIFAKPFFS